jgi:hypothetical protein
MGHVAVRPSCRKGGLSHRCTYRTLRLFEVKVLVMRKILVLGTEKVKVKVTVR